MKKITTFAVALGLMASVAASASAAEVTGTDGTTTTTTVTASTYGNVFTTPVITPTDIKPATPQIIITRPAAFYFTLDGFPISMLAPQVLDTTGAIVTDASGNEWREIYTWLGKAWIKVPASAYIITP